MNFFLPGSVTPARFTSIVESRVSTWIPDHQAAPVSLVGEGFSLGRSTTGTYLDLYYQGLTPEDLQARKAFMEQYLNWPVLVGDAYGAFLQEVQTEEIDRSAQIFGNIQVYLRRTYDGSNADDIRDAPITFSSFVALLDRVEIDGVLFPAVNEEPFVSSRPTTQEYVVPLRITHHELTDAVRSPDDPQTVLIQSTEAIEGRFPVSGALPISIGAKAEIGPDDPTNLNPPREFTLERLVRRSAVQVEARFERIIT